MRFKIGDYIYTKLGDTEYVMKVTESLVLGNEKYGLKYIKPSPQGEPFSFVHLSVSFVDEYFVKMSRDDMIMFYL